MFQQPKDYFVINFADLSEYPGKLIFGNWNSVFNEEFMLNIDSLINCTTARHGMINKTSDNFLRLDFWSNLNELTSTEIFKELEKSSNFIHQRLSQSKNILIHCSLGITRSPATVLAFLIWKNPKKFDIDLGLKALKQYNPKIKDPLPYLKILIDWQKYKCTINY